MLITIVVSLTQRVDIVFGELVEIVLLTGHDVHLVDDHMILAIWSLSGKLNRSKLLHNTLHFTTYRMFMPKPNNMSQLVHLKSSST